MACGDHGDGVLAGVNRGHGFRWAGQRERMNPVALCAGPSPTHSFPLIFVLVARGREINRAPRVTEEKASSHGGPYSQVSRTTHVLLADYTSLEAIGPRAP